MKSTPLLFLNVIIIATCGLIYELLAATVSSYVLGDSVTQFSFIIGVYLFAMGVGSYLSKYVEKNVAEKFIDIELAVAVIGGFSAPLLKRPFSHLLARILRSLIFTSHRCLKATAMSFSFTEHTANRQTKEDVVACLMPPRRRNSKPAPAGAFALLPGRSWPKSCPVASRTAASFRLVGCRVRQRCVQLRRVRVPSVSVA